MKPAWGLQDQDLGPNSKDCPHSIQALGSLISLSELNRPRQRLDEPAVGAWLGR